MLKTYLALLLLLLVGTVIATEHQLTADQLNNPQLLKLLNNYFGCKVWSEDSCLQCSDRFAFNKNGVCCEIQTTCEQFNIKQGICQKCYEGYSITDGKCNQVDKTTASNIGCSLWKSGVCQQCSKRWFFNAQKICVPVSDLCSTWSEQGACATCYYGYIVKEGVCVENNDRSIVPESNLLCKTWVGQVCSECADRTFFNKDGVCLPVSSLCNTFDKASGNCLTCFKGYDAVEGKCVDSPSNTAHPADLGCGLWDWANQKCLKCSEKWAANAEGKCVPVADQCKAHAQNGKCTECFKGYDLAEGKCVFSASNNAQPADLGCGLWDWNNQKCLKCSERWTANAEGKCVPVSDHCKIHAANGDCTGCHKGYDLAEGKCVFSASNNAQPADLGCGLWDWDNQKCLKCSSSWVNNAEGKCVPVADQCKAHDQNGLCTSCFKGYDLAEGKCLFSASNNAQTADLGCGLWDWDNQKCLKCSNQWVSNAEGKCVPVSDQCKAHAQNGQCTECFKGYDLIEGKCVFSASNNAHPTGLGCGVWDWDNQKCLKCSNRWVFNTNNICAPVDDNCNAFNANDGSCTSCYHGYAVNAGKCVSVNPLCKTLNADGTCATCYAQNVVHNGNCVPINKLANILLYYAECCPQKLQELKKAASKQN